MATKQRKKWAELTPAYRKRLESAYKAGKYGQGYSSAGRAYAAKAPAQVARGQAKTSEAARSKARRQIAKAKAWAKQHSGSAVTDYTPPAGADTVTQGQYADAYLKAMKELEKGWKRGKVSQRGQFDYGVIDDWLDLADIPDLGERFNNYLEMG